jgi:urease accessory protein
VVVLTTCLIASGGSVLEAAQSYPFLGLCHFLAAAAAGVWGGSLGGHALLLLPLASALRAGFGFVLGADGLQMLPLVEPMVWISTLILGLAAAKAISLPLDEIVGLAALFGIVHGQALGAAFGSSAAMP